jgi:hypothetical protein
LARPAVAEKGEAPAPAPISFIGKGTADLVVKGIVIQMRSV